MLELRKITSLSVFLGAFLFIQLQTITAQTNFKLSKWRAYSSMHDTKNVSMDSRDRVWGVTPGGAYCYDQEAEKFNEFRNINEMLTARAIL